MAKTKEPEKAEMQFVSDVRTLDYVEDEATYYVTLQLGASNRWRGYGGGSWVEDRNYVGDSPQDRRFIHTPAIHERCGPFSGRVVNGLISTHNSWKEKNSARVRGGGEIQFQLLVLSLEATNDAAVDQGNRGSKFEDMIRTIVKETIEASTQATVKAVLETLGK